MTATKTTKKVRANKIAKGDRVMLESQPVEVAKVTHTDHYPGWPSHPYTTVMVTYVPGTGFLQTMFGWSEWVEVAR